MKRAKIIVIEGTDGSGKETQSKKAEKYLIDKGFKVKRYSFPIYNSPTCDPDNAGNTVETSPNPS